MPGLLPFQIEGANFLAARSRALLADEMRVGKTPQSIVASSLVGAKTVLVLCPAIARLNWVAEFRNFAGREARALVKKTTPVHPEVTVCSYDIVANKQVYPRIAKPYDVVILDEAHYLRTFNSNRTRAAFGIANGAHYAWALTGTPTPRDHADLYPLLRHFGAIANDYWSFVKQFCDVRHTGFEDKIVGSRNADELASILRPIMLRRLLRDVAPQMPKARWTQVAVEPGPIPVNSMTAEELESATQEERDLSNRLSQANDLLFELDPEAAKNFRRLVGLRKVAPVAELVAEELDSGLDKIVIFGWHRDVLMALHQALIRYDARLILGSTPDDYKEAAKRDFKHSPLCRVVIANVVAAGTAIDLSTADNALFIEEDWLPGNNLQAAMRVVSQFKTRPVFVRSAVVPDSVDSTVQKTLFRRLSGTENLFSNTVAPSSITL